MIDATRSARAAAAGSGRDDGRGEGGHGLGLAGDGLERLSCSSCSDEAQRQGKRGGEPGADQAGNRNGAKHW